MDKPSMGLFPAYDYSAIEEYLEEEYGIGSEALFEWFKKIYNCDFKHQTIILPNIPVYMEDVETPTNIVKILTIINRDFKKHINKHDGFLSMVIEAPEF